MKVGGGGGVDKSERTVDVSARQCMFLLFFFFFLNITVERDIVYFLFFYFLSPLPFMFISVRRFQLLRSDDVELHVLGGRLTY